MAAERKAGTSYIMLYHCALVLHGKPKKCIALYSLVALSTTQLLFVGLQPVLLGAGGLYCTSQEILFYVFLAFSIGKQREQSSDRN